MRNEDLQNNLSLYYKNDRDINSFCNSRSITLNKAQKSFNIFESPYNTLNNIFTKSFHCEYYVTNKYYLEHNMRNSSRIDFLSLWFLNREKVEFNNTEEEMKENGKRRKTL